jgi:hypothetical protein
MEPYHAASPKEEARTISSGGIIMGTIFWDARGSILVDFLPRKEPVNVVHYVQIFQKLIHFMISTQ